MQKDIEYGLESLREQWKSQPEQRLNIEAQAAALNAELNQVKAKIPASISEIERQDAGSAIMMIELLIVNASEYLNLSQNMTPTQIKNTAELLGSAYSHLTLEHVAIVLQRAMLGKYEVYGRLDGQVIGKWLQDFYRELQQVAADAQLNRHLASKESRAGDGTVYRLKDLIPKT